MVTAGRAVVGRGSFERRPPLSQEKRRRNCQGARGGQPGASPVDQHLPTHGTSPPTHRGLYLMIAVGVGLVASYGSLVPFRYRPMDFAEAAERFLVILRLPPGMESRADWASNVLLLVPIGFACTAVLAPSYRPVHWRAMVGLPVLAGCASFSLLIEFAQPGFHRAFPRRTISGLSSLELGWEWCCGSAWEGGSTAGFVSTGMRVEAGAGFRHCFRHTRRV